MPTGLRSAVRSLRASPGTTTLIILLLVISLAAGIVTFSVVDHVVLRPLPFPDDGRLFTIGQSTTDHPEPGFVAPQDYLAWVVRLADQSDTATIGGAVPLRLTTTDGSVVLRTFGATWNLFDVLGVAPAVGRMWTADAEREGSEPLVMLSDRVWRQQFGADPAIVGRAVSFGRESRTVAGVMPPGFNYPVTASDPTDVWVPIVIRDRDRDLESRGRSYMFLPVGRLKAGARLDSVRAAVEQVTASLARQYPMERSTWQDARPVVQPLRAAVAGPARSWMLLVLGAVALLLLVACFNVANLLLARATVRAPELAMRAALGASPGGILRTLLLESALLSLSAATVGLVAAVWGVRLVRAVLPAGIARAETIALDVRVAVVSIAVAVITGLAFGAIPAWRASRVDLLSVLQRAGRRTAGAPGRVSWRSALLISEIAFVALLLIATTVIVTSFVRVVRTDLGFDRQHLVTFRLPSPPLGGVKKEDQPAARALYFADVMRRAVAVPGVAGAAISDGGLPLLSLGVSYALKTPAGRSLPSVSVHSVSPDYARVTGVRLVHGRFVESQDTSTATHVMVVNEQAARGLFPGEDPLGQTIDFFGPITIVGVVQAQRLVGPEIPARPEVYVPLDQGLTMFGGFGLTNLVVRAAGSADALVPRVQAALQPLQPAGARPVEATALEAQFDKLTASRRFSAGLMTAFGVIAVGIGALGVYGVMAFLVAQRTREVGVRVALGATRARIVALVLGQAALPVALGVVIGVAIARLAGRVLRAVVFEVQPDDPVIAGAVAVTLLAVGLVAAFAPALRAARVDPVIALRND